MPCGVEEWCGSSILSWGGKGVMHVSVVLPVPPIVIREGELAGSRTKKRTFFSPRRGDWHGRGVGYTDPSPKSENLRTS